MKAHFSNCSDLTPVISFLLTSKLACDTNCIYEGGVTRVLLIIVIKIAIATMLISRMSEATLISAVAALVNTVEPTTQKNLFWFYLKLINYLLKKFANDQYISKMVSAVLRFPKPASITLKQCAEDLYAI